MSLSISWIALWGMIKVYWLDNKQLGAFLASLKFLQNLS